MKLVVAISLIFGSLMMAACPVVAQTWMQTTAPSNHWQCIAASADGTKLIAGVNSSSYVQPALGPIYRSTDSGATWTAMNAPSNYWRSLASSADGTKLFAVADAVNYTLFISTNAGNTWISNHVENVPALWSVVCSADGDELAAIVYDTTNNSWIYTSTNSGFSWVQTSAPEAVWTTNWSCIACSADGSTIVAGMWNPGGLLFDDKPGLIYASRNSGKTWERAGAPPNNWTSIACSADGMVMVAACEIAHLNQNPIFTSQDAGVTWSSSDLYFQHARNWTGVASSADGSKLLGVNLSGKGDGIYLSTDSGASWMISDTTSNGWKGVASSADGSEFLAVNRETICKRQTVPTPQLTLSTSNGVATFSWTLPSDDFVLQESSDPSANDWVTLTNVTVFNLTSLQEQLTLFPTNDRGFFRLMSQ